jgi:hypothetical protein
MRLIKDTRGQAAVLSVVFLGGLLGMAALVLDVGSWFRESRATQAAADAAALAGAQALPTDPGSAKSVALSYAGKNGGGVLGSDITITSDLAANDTITVKVKRNSPSFFSKLFGIGSADIGSHAVARTDGMQDARYVAPIGIPLSHSDLSGNSCPCFKHQTQLDLGKAGAPGAFHLINLDGSKGGTGQKILGDWIRDGYNDALPLGGYYSDTGAKWNSSEVQDALSKRVGTDLLFPVYDTIKANGTGAQYHIVAWAAFYLTGFEADGVQSGHLYGYFDQVVWEGLQETTPGGGGPDLGAYTVQLVK